MKIAIVLLFCLGAFASGSSDSSQKLESKSKNIIPFGLLEDTEAFIKKSQDEFDQKLNEYNKFAEDIEKQADDILENSQKRIEESINVVLNRIRKEKTSDNFSMKCFEIYEVELIQIKELALRGIKECIQGVLKSLKDFLADVTRHGLELAKNINRLKTLVLECYNADGTINAIKCAFKNIAEVTDLIKKIVGGVVDMVHAIIVRGKEIVESIKFCAEGQIETALINISAVNAQMGECYRI